MTLNRKPVFLFWNLKWWSYKIIVLPSLQHVTPKNSQNRNETGFINVLWHITSYMNIGISNWHNWSCEPTNMTFLLHFSSLKDFWPPSTWNTLVHTSWSEMERCDNVFSATQNAKNVNQLKHKTKCITDYLLTVRSSRMKDYTCQ